MLLLRLLIAIVLFGSFSQNNSGVVGGRITHLDGSGGVSGVQVLLIGPVSGPALNAITSNPSMAAEIAEGASLGQVTLTTGEDGRFRFSNLAPGSYTIRAKRDGYFGSLTSGSPPTSSFATTAVN